MGVTALKFLPWLLLTLGAWTDAHAACSCPKDTSPLEQQIRAAMREADYVALIEIKATRFEVKSYEEHVAILNPQTQQSEDKTRQVNERVLLATFEAQRVYKGPKSSAEVETPAAADLCGVSFESGATYLVYANENEEPARVSTYRCMRTALQSNATRDIEILDAATKPKSVLFQPSGALLRFSQAMDRVHSHVGAGDERWEDPKLAANLSEAMQVAAELAKSDPLTGYSQVIQAEVTSIWNLGADGKPVEALQEALLLTEDALRIAPNLAQSHVARARTYAKSARLNEAEDEIQRAFQIDPRLDTAMFVQAEIYRFAGDGTKAEEWMRGFIEATPQPVQKANGYEWIARLNRDIAYKPQPYNRDVYLLLAKMSFERSLDLEPSDPWRLANFAGFLNELVADFAGAEKYASKALAIEDLSPARYQLAAARYQALQSKAGGMDVPSLKAAVAEIETTAGLSLEELLQVGGFRDVVNVRLMRLQRRLRE